MNKLRIVVYAICKNEEQFVDRWIDSMSEADEIVVTDTGSTDGTVGKLRSRGAKVYVEEIRPWRFDVARNRSLSHVPDDADICVCTDLDEVFHPGWRALLEAAWQPDTTTANYLFNWSLKADGTPATQFTYFKVHSRWEHEWVYPIHECLRYKGTRPEKKVFVEGMVLDHYPDDSKSRSSYLPLLEMAVAEDPQGDRMTYYLGREYMYARQWQKCIDTLKRHLSLPSAWWKEERCASMRWIARAYKELGNLPEAYRWHLRAIAEVPHMRDPYVEFAQAAYNQSDWVTCFYMAEEALKIPARSKVYINMPYSWDHTPNDLAAIACYRLGLWQRSLDHACKALAFSPEDARLRRNLELVEEANAVNS
jgi:glycosyltransferase involved in cell wall biosynthesis